MAEKLCLQGRVLKLSVAGKSRLAGNFRQRTFLHCTSLESVNIPKGFADSKFPSNVFRDCISLTSLIEVPETVTIIGMATFNGCTSLAGVKLKGNVPPSLEYSVFGNSTFPIYVPEAAVNAYKSASGWTSLASRIMGY